MARPLASGIELTDGLLAGSVGTPTGAGTSPSRSQSEFDLYENKNLVADADPTLVQELATKLRVAFGFGAGGH